MKANVKKRNQQESRIVDFDGSLIDNFTNKQKVEIGSPERRQYTVRLARHQSNKF